MGLDATSDSHARPGSVPVAFSSSYTYIGAELDLAAQATNWKSYFGSRLAPHIRGRVLEVGAGLGGTTVHLRSTAVREWVCLEPDAALADRLHATLARQPSTVPTRVIVGDLRSIARDDRFDAILYIDVLEHIEDDAGELRRAQEHLAPGGKLIVLCPAFQMLFSEFDRAIGHFRRYTRATLSAVFPPGMQPVERFYLDSLGMLASLANRLFLRQTAPNDRQVRFWDEVIIPVSRVLDPLLLHAIGRSVIAIYGTMPDRGAADA
jgi:SAM-dependent methyltransferase